ncbi:hypothetical protein Bca52824_055044 [Brassica carinata]|uniref:Uncharacterized protein n=1 Tax=Brassica carinata TaxID=52824 RepID=A0A8X7REJ2_BRACI|nr:hypothetical protein Bca52824_055044 [Brassica carinata]
MIIDTTDKAVVVVVVWGAASIPAIFGFPSPHNSNHTSPSLHSAPRFLRLTTDPGFPVLLRVMRVMELVQQPVVTIFRISLRSTWTGQTWLLQALLPLAIVENKPAYKAVKQQAEDWDDVQVCSISEILVAVEVSKFDPNSQNSAEDVTTPFSKRKDNDDLPDVTSASKKLCTDTIKPEKTKTE